MLDGVDLSRVPPLSAVQINMMFQSYALFSMTTAVEQNIAFGLKQDKLPESQNRQPGAEMLALNFYMQEFAKRKTASAFRRSRQRQRAALARSPAKTTKTAAVGWSRWARWIKAP